MNRIVKPDWNGSELLLSGNGSVSTTLKKAFSAAIRPLWLSSNAQMPSRVKLIQSFSTTGQRGSSLSEGQVRYGYRRAGHSFWIISDHLTYG